MTLEKLLSISLSASKGPWSHTGSDDEILSTKIQRKNGDSIAFAVKDEDIRHIATFNPDLIFVLLEELIAARHFLRQNGPSEYRFSCDDYLKKSLATDLFLEDIK